LALYADSISYRDSIDLTVMCQSGVIARWELTRS